MIIARIDCGMGNQMFAYAAGFVTAKRLGAELVLDLEWFNKKQRRKDPRPYSLGCFPAVQNRKASFSDVYRLFPFQAVINFMYSHHAFWFLGRHFIREIMTAMGLIPEGKARKKFLEADPLLLPIPLSRVFTQAGSIYSEKFAMIPDDTYIWGGFQSERFSAGYHEELRKQFAFAPAYFYSKYIDGICSCNSVAVHVRLGDKLRKGEADFTAEYIRHSIEKIYALTDSPSLFVFSDDIEWCKKNLPQIYSTDYCFIEGNTPAQDMALMTRCRHIITSASTFSWWAAWLNDNPRKIVIAPSQKLWCRNLREYEDIYPNEWLILGN